MRNGLARNGLALPAALGVGALASVLLGSWVGATGEPGPAAAAARTPVALAVAVARLATDGLGAIGIGLALLPLLAGGSVLGGSGAGGSVRRCRSGGADPVSRAWRGALRRAARLGVLVAAGWAIVALLALWLQAADAAGGGPFALSPTLLGAYAAAVAAGRGLLLTLACAVLVMALQLAALVRWTRMESARAGSAGGAGAGGRGPSGPRYPEPARPRYPELVLGAGLLGVLPGPVTGHVAGHAGHDPAVLTIALHVVAASVWVGGLLAVVVVLAGNRRLVADALPRFSTVAGYCAGVVAVTGVLSAVLRLPTPGALVSTGYGVLLLAKAACLAGLVGLGWRARRRLLTRVAGSAGRRSDAPVPLARWLALELVVMAVVFGLAAALAGAAPA